jgi:hypothetical protein
MNCMQNIQHNRNGRNYLQISADTLLIIALRQWPILTIQIRPFGFHAPKDF